MLGGVCAGVARSTGLDPLLLRVVVVAVTVLTGGAGLLAYLAAWVLIPAEAAAPGPAAAGATPPQDLRTAWSAVGDDLRALGDELRRPAPAAGDTAEAAEAADGTAAATPPPGAVPPPRSPLTAADDAATALGDRLRTPEVQAGARKAAASTAQALTASVDEVARRLRRDPG